jgi:GTP-sensing pleiotropic transcriptional regulator CodY
LQLAKEQRRVALVQMAICCLSYSKIFNTIIKDLLKEELLEAIKKNNKTRVMAQILYHRHLDAQLSM